MRTAMSASGKTTVAPMRLSTSPWTSLVALEMTLGTPSLMTSMVVRMLMSTCSPMQTVTVSQFWMPVSLRAVSLRLSTVKA